MVTRKVPITYCDQCGEDQPTTRYFITGPEGRVKLDLCDSCAEPLAGYVSLVGNPKPVKNRARTRSKQPATMEEVRKAKARQKRAAARRT